MLNAINVTLPPVTKSRGLQDSLGKVNNNTPLDQDLKESHETPYSVSYKDSQHHENTLSGYRSPRDVEMKALPVSNLSIGMFNGVFISGFPIKLRLYINSAGEVVKIKEIKVMEQDRPMVNRLTQLLYKLTFLPAKKGGVAVDSFQDVEFSF